MKKLFTSESVTEGHPDKICDLISDSVLDEILSKDPSARVACETCVTTGFVLVMGEITTECYADIEAIARKTISEIGYNDLNVGFDAKTCSVLTAIHQQSPDISNAVTKSLETRKTKANKDNLYEQTGAGDQGMMFGYACNETEELMPLAVMLAHKLTKKLTEVRKSGLIPYLRPDGKSQVTVEYVDGKAKRVDTVVVSCQHAPEAKKEQIEQDILEYVIKPSINKELLDKNTRFLINPSGSFIVGGPMGDSGLTGRKIIVDTYGGYCPHGGGAFSGKDPTKVDRSASYMTRYVAKNIVASGLASKCELQISYAIGVAHPISIAVNTYGTGIISDENIAEIASKVFDFRPAAIIDHLNLRSPIYRETTNYGHFGKPNLPWEKTDKINEIIELSKKYTLNSSVGQASKNVSPELKNISSFEIDHIKLNTGFYLSREDNGIKTYDLRFVAPRCRIYLPNDGLHTIEHQMAVFFRNSSEAENIIYFGPMGCRTGFYLVARLNYEDAKALTEKALEFVLDTKEVIGSTEKECGNHSEHNLTIAKALCEKYLNDIKNKTFSY